MKRLAAIGLMLALFCAGACLAADIDFPALTGRVVDQVGLLSPTAKQGLTQELADHETKTGQQVVVAIVSSLQGQEIEDYGYRLGRFWGIGQKDKDTGAILLVAPKEHKVRIEVGYGLEGTLTDTKSAQIIHDIILPAFRQGQMSQGVIAGTDAILQVLGADAPPSKAATPPGDRGSMAGEVIATSSPHQLFGVGLFVLVWIVLMLFSLRRGSGFLFLPMMMGGDQSWGGGSDGGFSGGGGSFGGGGASGSW